MAPDLPTFHPFPHLPDELRLQIWRLAASQPRTLTMHAYPPQSRDVDYLVSPDPIPALIHTCHESRMEALMSYTKAFSCGVGPRYTWVNFNLDTIRVHDYDLKKISDADKAAMKYVDVEVRDVDSFCYFYMNDLSTTRSLKQLRILSFVDHSELWDWLWSLENAYWKWFGAQEQWICPKISLLGGETGTEILPNEVRLPRAGWRGGRARPSRGGMGSGRGRGT
jgi:hypothetical protein